VFGTEYLFFTGAQANDTITIININTTNIIITTLFLLSIALMIAKLLLSLLQLFPTQLEDDLKPTNPL